MGAALLIGAAGCSSEEPASPVRETRHQKVIEAARSWLDQLEVDPVDLIDRGVQGKKKLAEILAAYLYLLVYSNDPSERPGLLARVRELAAQANRPEYHNMLECSLREFNENRMSYLRAAWLLDLLGQDTGFYREKLEEMRPRLDAVLAERPPAQTLRLAMYYDYFGWEKPEALSASGGGILARRMPAERYQPLSGYAIAHQVSTAFLHGLRRTQDVLDAEDLDYLRRVLPRLVARFAKRRDIDLLAELVSAMTYLELHEQPAHRAGIALLLRSQNPDGSWGNYEKHRPTYGDVVAQKLYLHTTMVTLRALLEAHDDAWLRSAASDRP